MTRFYISDLHLGDRGARDNFQPNEEAFNRFLDFVEATPGAGLYILGDLFDWWQCNVSASLFAYEALIRRLWRTGFWIPGNHDNAFCVRTSREQWESLRICGLNLLPSRAWHTTEDGTLLMHGHEADPSCSSVNPGIGACTAIMSGLIEDRAAGSHRPNGDAEDRFINLIQMPLKIWNRLLGHSAMFEEVIQGVEDFRMAQKAAVVIYGHTHEAGQIGEHHFNCGCWCRNRNTFVRQDDGGAISIWEWTGTEAVPFERYLLG